MAKAWVILLSYKYKYGEFSDNQINDAKIKIRKSIFFLLLCVDPETSSEYSDVDVNDVFNNVQNKLSGMNIIFGEPVEFVTVISLIEEAKRLYNSENFNYKKYRKLILDAGAEIMRISVGD